MRLTVRSKSFRLSQDMRERIQSRLAFALSRFNHRVRDVTTILTDVNGPKGGVDKRCRLVVRLRSKGEVTIEQSASDYTAAIGQAADRIGYNVSRTLKRRRDAKFARAGLSPRMNDGAY